MKAKKVIAPDIYVFVLLYKEPIQGQEGNNVILSYGSQEILQYNLVNVLK